MRVIVQGQGALNLDQNHFIGAGGQGSVYAIGDTAYKVANHGGSALPEGKIRELQVLPTPLFARPEHLIQDAKGVTLGYTSRFIRNAYVLCQLFTRAFRDRVGLTHDKVLHLVAKMHSGFVIAHQHQILLVDPNEMNFLVDRNLEDLFFIDTDGYQTKSYPATAIMESIRDRHMAHPHAFTEGTDWFSFAVTSFQLFTGIHPYKGKHPTIKGFDDRMTANVSVFNKAVSVPSTAYPVTVIPGNWRKWYEAVFDHGERTAPPAGFSDHVPVQVVVAKTVRATSLVVEELMHTGHTIRDLWVVGDTIVVSTTDGVWANGRRVSDVTTLAGVTSGTGSQPTLVYTTPDGVELFDLESKTRKPVAIDAQRVTSYAGSVYAKVNSTIVGIDCRNVVTLRTAANVVPNATHLFRGVALQNMLGSMFASIFPEPGKAYQIRLPELDAYRILDAQYDAGVRGGVLVVLGASRDNRVDRITFRFDADFKTHDCRVTPDTDGVGVNFAVTDAGVCVCLVNSGELELTSVNLGSTSARVVKDPWLEGGVRLFKRGAQLLASKNGNIYGLKLA